MRGDDAPAIRGTILNGAMDFSTPKNDPDALVRRDWAVALGLLILALITRVYGIWQWDLVQDEWFTFSEAPKRFMSLVNPAYYALVVASTKVFGVSEWAARLPAVVLAIISVPVFYLTWKTVIGRNAALVGALLTVMSSWHLFHSQNARFYTGVFLFGSLAFYFFYKAVRDDSLKSFAWALVATVVAILFHLTAVLIAATFGLFAVVVLLVGDRAAVPCPKRISLIYVVLCAVAAPIVIYLFWPTLMSWHVSGQNWGYGSIGQALQLTKYIQFPIAFGAFFGIFLMPRSDMLLATYFAIGIGLPAGFLILGANFLTVRPDYVFYTMPLVFAAAGFACERVRLALSEYRIGAHVLTAVIIANMVPEFVSHYTDRAARDLRKSVEFVEQAYQPGDRIYAYSAFNYFTKKNYKLEPWLGNPYDNSIDWSAGLRPYAKGGQRTWFIFPVQRKALAGELEAWLLSNASLKWRLYVPRFDYTFHGMQVFLSEGSKTPPAAPR